MQAARYYGNRDVRIDEIDAPSPEADEVLIDVEACGICRSDVKEYQQGPKFYGDDLPYAMGHEIGGTVVEAGEDADVPVGTDLVLNPIVACGSCRFCDDAQYHLCQNMSFIGAHRQGGYAELVAAPAENVVPLPDGVSPEMAAVAEPLAVAFHAVTQSTLRLGDSVAVVGLGPIGLGLVQVAKAVGAGSVYASGHRAARRALATESGADLVVDPRETDPVERFSEETDGGVDVAFEVAGNESALNDAIGSTRPGGHTTIVGVFGGDVSIDPMTLVNFERSVNASAGYRGGPHAERDFGSVVELFADGRLDPDPLVTSRIGLGEIVESGFEALSDGESEDVKILVKP